MTSAPPTPPPAPPREGRVTLVLTSPRSPAGLLTWAAWERLRAASAVFAADPEPAWRAAFDDAGVPWLDVSGLGVGERAGRLVADAAAGGVEIVWWGSPDGDPGLTDALAEHLSRRAVAGRPPEVEVLTGSHDAPGARVLDLVAVMQTLRSPGGSSWDAAQTHESLLPYLLEETYEVIEAIESGDPADLVEELGDLLLQVVFHADLGSVDDVPFGIDDVAAGIVAKLVRRNPHVFAGDASPDGEALTPALTPAEVEHRWEQLKAVEKAGRAPFDGIPVALPALARAQKMLDRLARAGVDQADQEAAIVVAAGDDPLAHALLRVVRAARESGTDAEASLRAALGRLPSAPGAPANQ